MSFEYQIKAKEKLSQLFCGALFMKMGTGKTKTILDIISKHRDKIDCVAWIAPASLLNDICYLAEITKWNKKLVKINKFTIEGVSQSDAIYMKLINLAKNNRVFCVIDESIYIKNLMSKRTKRLLDQGSLFKFRFILNGTSATKSLLDLYSQIQFLSPKILNMNEAQFANHFLEYEKSGHRPYTRWSRPHNEQALIEILRPYIFDQDLEIKANKETILYNLTLSDKEAFEYREFKENELSKHELDFISLSQKFQHFYTISKSKIEKLKEIVSKTKKIIIFVKFISEIETIKIIYPHAFVYSGQRKDNIKAFSDCDNGIMIMTYGTGAFGLNLQFCNEIIFFTPTFDYKQKAQAEARIYRIGQDKDVKIHEFYLNTGLDDLINNSLNKKEAMLKNIENHIKNGGEL